MGESGARADALGHMNVPMVAEKRQKLWGRWRSWRAPSESPRQLVPAGARPTGAALRVVSYNIHKGWGPFNRHLTIAEMREALHALAPDLLLLQEVQGAHLGHAQRHPLWPAQPQHHYLGAEHWPERIYGGNLFHELGHHGNAVLSRFPVQDWANHDVSAHRWERRGILHCAMVLPHGHCLHVFCVHMGLRARWRRMQLERLRELIAGVPPRSPIVVGGDFNDWGREAEELLAAPLGLEDAFAAVGRRAPPRTYPARGLAFGRLDRLYVRGCEVHAAQVPRGRPWSHLSDHLPLVVDLALEGG